MKSIIFIISIITSSVIAGNNLFGLPSTAKQLSHCKYNVTTCASSKYHTGLDFSAYGSDDILATNAGKIVRLEKMNNNDHGMGTNIIIEHTLVDGKKIYSTYSHLASYVSTLYKGYKVKKGEIIGTKGGSGKGNPTYWGKHLHFEMKTKAVTGSPSPINGHYGYTPKNPSNYGYLNPFDYIGKIAVKSDTNENDSKSSIIDGAGSLVSPNEDCWGCNKDQANMHSHSGKNSTVVFQWRYDKNSCSQIDISANRDIGEVFIRAKGWKSKTTEVATSVKLSSSPISIRRPNRNSNWTTLAVTTQKPLDKTAKIYAYCKKKGSNYLNGNRSIANKDLVNFELNYVWSGTGSIISRSKKSDYDGFGHNKDWAITYFKKKSLTTFQWDSTMCHEITITNGKTNDFYGNNVKVDIKPWNLKDWESACHELPCTIKKSDDYYILKVKSPIGAITKGYIQVKCEN